jgi:hypothetical protein
MTSPEPRLRLHQPRAISWAVAAVFAVLYTFFLWGGISNLVGVVTSLSAFGVSVGGEIWSLLIGYAVTPVVVFVAALLVGLRLRVGQRVVVYLVGLGVVGVVSLGLLAIA